MSLWRQIQRTNFTSPEELARYLQIDIPHYKDFPLNLPRRLAEKMEKGNPDDPLFKQFVSTAEESVQKEGFGCNPVGDEEARQTPKLLKKYHNRALLTTTSACAMHCRYCFRRHFSYEKSNFEQELSYLRENESVNEVILSGGDPLSLTNKDLRNLFKEIRSISHIKRIRLHSRFIIGIPERVDQELIEILNTAQKVWFIMHINHPKELDSDIIKAIHTIQALGIPVMNQAVLLKGVNDSPEVLKKLSETLVDEGIYFYYLHQLDKVRGAHHFEVPINQGKSLMKELAKRVSGYGLPRYVIEEAGASQKTPLF